MGPPEVSGPAENVTAEKALTDHSVQSLPLATGRPRPREGSDFPWCSVGEGGRVGENQLLMPQLDLSPSPAEPPFELMGVLDSMHMSLN